MEHAREHGPAGDARGELGAVARRGGDERRIGGHRVVGVHEVDVGAVGDAREHGDGPHDAQRIPAHVRHLARGVAREAHHAPGEDAEPAHAGRLLALLEEELHADADAEKGASRARRLTHRLDEPRRREVFHARAEGALAGQDDGGRGGDAGRVARDLGRVARPLDRLLCAAQVADAVVESTPFTRGSRWVAASSARASALKAASTTWWGLRPEAMRTWRFIAASLASASRKSWISSTSKWPIFACAMRTS